MEEEAAAAKQVEEDVARKLEEAAASKQLEEDVERGGGEEVVDVYGEERDGRGECRKEVEEKVTGEKRLAVDMVETVSPILKLDWGEALPSAVAVSPTGSWRPREETPGNGNLGKGETWQSWSPGVQNMWQPGCQALFLAGTFLLTVPGEVRGKQMLEKVPGQLHEKLMLDKVSGELHEELIMEKVPGGLHENLML